MKNILRNPIVLLAVVLLGVAGWYFIYLHPQRLELAGMEKRLDGLRMQFSTSSSQANRIAQLRQDVANVEEKLRKIEARLALRSDVPQILQQILLVGQEHGLELGSIYPKYDRLLQQGAGTEGAPLMVLPIELTLEGNFQAFGRFAESLSQAGYLISIVRYELTISKETYPAITAQVLCHLFLRTGTAAGTGVRA